MSSEIHRSPNPSSDSEVCDTIECPLADEAHCRLASQDECLSMLSVRMDTFICCFKVLTNNYIPEKICATPDFVDTACWLPRSPPPNSLTSLSMALGPHLLCRQSSKGSKGFHALSAGEKG